MKIYIIILFLISPFISLAQDDVYAIPKVGNQQPSAEILSFYPTQDGKVVYEKVITIEGETKEKLYSASTKWISDSFKSAKSVIESQDASTGQIVGWAYGELPPVNPEALMYVAIRLKYHIQINCKDGKARIRFYNINHHQSSSTYVSETNTPLESILVYNKKLSASKKEKAEATANRFNKYFDNLLIGYSNSLEKSKKDDF